jgi:hypothetical protein
MSIRGTADDLSWGDRASFRRGTKSKHSNGLRQRAGLVPDGAAGNKIFRSDHKMIETDVSFILGRKTQAA